MAKKQRKINDGHMHHLMLGTETNSGKCKYCPLTKSFPKWGESKSTSAMKGEGLK